MFRRRKRQVRVFMSIAVLAICGCSRDEGSQRSAEQVDNGDLQGKLLLTGSSTISPLADAIAKRFETLHPGVHIEVQAGGSLRGVQDARQGMADIGMCSRALNDDEHDLLAFPIARDGVCFVVHKSNPIHALSTQQLAEIYLGKMTNWREVGGRDAPIAVISRSEKQSELELVSQYFHINSAQIKAHAVATNNALAIQAAASDPHAIVFVSIGEAERCANGGMPIKLLPLDDVAPTVKSVRTGDFPLTRSLVLITGDPPAGLKKAFILFSLSSQVTDLVETFDFVPLGD